VKNHISSFKEVRYVSFSLIKPNYFKTTFFIIIFTYLMQVYRSKMAMEPKQASPRSKMDGTRLKVLFGHFEPVYLATSGMLK
jgi:hypothetical protein